MPPFDAFMDMPAACRNPDGDSWTCAAVYHWTDGNEGLSHAAEWLIGRPLAIVSLILIGIVVRWLLHRLIDRVVRRAEGGVLPTRIIKGPLRSTSEASAMSNQRRVQRARTMGSLLKSIVTGVVTTVVAVMVVSELGYNIAPLIASAGILGVALGFGAQSLVKDFLSGIFMIFEDQYGVGDVVDVGEATGTVEAVGLRVTRLRDVDGTVWYVRNGEILRVGNQSQNWARTVLDISVGYQEDLARIRRILKDVAQELWQDPKYKSVIIEEPEVWGVQSLSADSVVVRVTLKTAPMEQWNVAREMRERIKARFDAEGIVMPLSLRMPHAAPWPRDPAAHPVAPQDPAE